MAAPFTLRVYRGERFLRAEEFSRDLVKIGRLASAHLVLDDEQVARIHAVIEVAPDGRMSIIDMGSTAGTLVNGKRTTKGPLQGGDEIAVGGLRIEVVTQQRPAAAVVAPAPAQAISPAAGLLDDPLDVESPPLDELDETAGLAEHRRPAAPGRPAGGGPARSDGPLTGSEPLRAAAPAPARQPAPEPEAPVAAPASTPAPQPRPSASKSTKPSARPSASQSTRQPARQSTGQSAVPDRRSQPLASAADPDGTGVELRLLWGDTLIEAATFVRPPKPITVGEAAGCDFQVEGVELPRQPYPILRFQEGEYRFLFAKGMHGGVERGGEVATISQLVKERQAIPDDRAEGAYAVTVPPDGAVRAELGSSLRFEARYRTPPKPAVVPWWERLDYRYLNLFLILFFLQSGFMVAAANWPQDVDTVADDLFKNPSRMAKFIIQPPEPQKKLNPALDKLAQELKGQEPGEMAEKHKGTEGQMGKKDAPKTTGRSAPKAIDPNAKDVVKNTGLLAVLGRGKGASGGLSTIFGQGGLGGDLKGAVGNMFGPVVGDSAGIGGLGIKGSGTGGGGSGETIGIGAVGTKGRGGGLGGYGSGVGGLGRKSDREVAIDTTNVKILGAIDPELIRKVIRENASQVRYCYEQELTLNPKLEGKVAIQWQIGPDGRASGCSLHSDTTLLNEKVQRCIMSRIVTWQFPKPKGGGIAIVKYPWILRTSGG